MTDFPVLQKPKLDDEQRELWDRLTLGPRGFYCGGSDAKRVPDFYNTYLQFPELGHSILDLAEGLCANKDISGRHRELIVLTTSAELGAQVEYDFRVPFARDQGIPDDVIRAIGERKAPEFDNQDDRLIYEANIQLLANASLTKETRNEVVNLVGYPGLMQLLGAVMLYVMTGYVTHVADVDPEVLEKQCSNFLHGTNGLPCRQKVRSTRARSA